MKMIIDNPEKRSETLLACFGMLMVFLAYYPTLISNYVPMDQWRAFRYSLEPGTSGDRFNACFNMVIRSYFFTGRWLVWFGECAEHAAVAQINDFKQLRWIVLAVVLLSVIAFRRILKSIFDSSMLATLLAVMIALLPGYAFMYYQGLAGMPVLLALLVSLASFPFTSRALTAEERNRKFYIDFGVGGILFLTACFIYPIFAFAIIPTAFIFSAFRPQSSFWQRVSLCARICIFYAVVALIYYLMVKTSVALAEYLGKSIPDLKDYRVDITTDKHELIHRLRMSLNELTRMPLASFLVLPVWLSVPILFGPAGIMFYEGQRLGWGRSKSILAVAGYLLSVPVILIASVSPWLLSHFPGAPYRHMLPIHFFMVLSFGVLISHGIQRISGIYGENNGRKAEYALAVVMIAIFCIQQISLSQLQVFDSTVEINRMRAAYREAIISEGLHNIKEIHVIRPELGRHYNGRRIDREFFPTTMTQSGHLVSMTHAVLREMLSTEQLLRLNLKYCGYDRTCAQAASQEELVISQSNKGIPANDLRKPHIIVNYSNLNKIPRVIKPYLFDPNTLILASSQYGENSPDNILKSTGPHIWHAEKSPQYPQWVRFKFLPAKIFSTVGIKAQSSSRLKFPERAPKHFIFQASNDGKSWTDLLEVDDAGFTSEKVWRTFKFENKNKYTYYRIYILSNGGSSLLTIQQVVLN